MVPIRKTRLSEQVVEAIETMIAEGDFHPGDRFLSEAELGKRLEVSRSSIREAVRILEVRGRVFVRHGKGIFIAGSCGDDEDPFRGWLKDNKASLIDHFEVRLIIEPRAAWYAAGKADGESVRAMEKACGTFAGYAASGDTAALVKADGDFHRLIARSTKNRTLYCLMKTMTTSLSEGWITSLHIPGRIEKTVGEHYAVFEAIRDGDPERAEKEMVRHLTNALGDIRASIEQPVRRPEEE
jgi:GntR family transcriptional repressor for pyruvate dehydrogenase complex